MKASVRSNLAVALAALLLMVWAAGALGVRPAGAIVISNNTTSDWTTIGGWDRLNPDTSGGWGYSIASSFSTGIGADNSYILNSVTLNAFQETSNPNVYSSGYGNSISSATVQMDLYSNTGGTPGGHTNPGLPGTSLGTLTSPVSFASPASNQDYNSDPTAFSATATFTTTGISLAANTYYWIVIKPLTGSLVWDCGNAPTGSGAVAAWAINGYPQVSGTPPFSGSNPPTFTPVNTWDSAYDPYQSGVYGDSAPYYMMEVDCTASTSGAPAPPTLLLFASGLLSLLGLRWRKKI